MEFFSGRFYAAEILLALEALHSKGVVYRDLKPENILISRSGHLVLTDFDLSFISEVKPKVGHFSNYRFVVSASPSDFDVRTTHLRLKKTLISPLQLVYPVDKKGKRKENSKPIFVAQPSGTSNSFVGTEEYIAPEVIAGVGHNSQVDWWAFGIFVYEMMFGRTPFRGRNRQRTFNNVLTREVVFPSSIPVGLKCSYFPFFLLVNQMEISLSSQASDEVKDLITSLLVKDPNERLGVNFGASEVKEHPLFRGINWALIRSKVEQEPVLNSGKSDKFSPTLFQQPPEVEVPVKYSDIVVPEDSLDEEMEWDEEEARSVSSSLDYGSSDH